MCLLGLTIYWNNYLGRIVQNHLDEEEGWKPISHHRAHRDRQVNSDVQANKSKTVLTSCICFVYLCVCVCICVFVGGGAVFLSPP